jgi:hypothetical protein
MVADGKLYYLDGSDVYRVAVVGGASEGVGAAALSVARPSGMVSFT